MTREPAPKRVVVLALDASPHSLAALEAGAEVAVAIDAELRGLFVEDENLMRTAELPSARTVSMSGRVDLLDRETMRRGLQRRAETARIALEETASRMQLIWSFNIVRGSVADELLRAASIADLVSLGRSGWSLRSAGLGSTTRSLLEESPSSLLLIEQGLKLGPSIAVIYDSSDAARRALELAASLSRSMTGEVVVILEKKTSEERAQEAATILRASGIADAKFQRLPRIDAHTLSEALRTSPTKGVLIPASIGVDIAKIAGILGHLRCPALIVR
jgi:nucleotide-binding universal stress UspA family protein